MKHRQIGTLSGILAFILLILLACSANNRLEKGENAELYFNQANTYAYKGNDRLAIAYFTKAIDFNPNYTEAYINRGNSYARKGQYNEAIADYNKAIEINPKYSMAYYARQYVSVVINIENYAILLKELNRDKEATEIEERADIFLKSLQSRESSYYLGYVPSEVLREYAILLHQEGEREKAEEINSLADWWDQANINAAEQLHEKTKNKK